MYNRLVSTISAVTLLAACGATQAREVPDTHPVATPLLKVSGRVQSIQGREVTLVSGQKLDMSQLPDNPTDGRGYPQLHVGDLIEAGGTLSKRALGPKQITVSWVEEIHNEAH